MISVSCIAVYIHVQLDVMLSFHVVQHAQIEKCIPRRFCIKQNNQIQRQMEMREPMDSLAWRDFYKICVHIEMLHWLARGGMKPVRYNMRLWPHWTFSRTRRINHGGDKPNPQCFPETLQVPQEQRS